RIACSDEDSGHVLLVFPAMLWILWVRREALQRTSPGGFWVGPVILGLGWLLWSWGLRQDVQAFWHGGAVLVTLGGVMTFLGLDVLKRAAPAILLLAFMVPVPGMIRQGMAQPMQHRTAQATQFAAEMIGMP